MKPATVGVAEHGFVDTVRNLALICESDLLGERVARRRQDSRRAINPDTLIRNLAELHIGQPVVHLEHGVGRYAGMPTLEAGGWRVFDAHLCQRRQTVCSGVVTASD